jgi:hypothetical protein
VSGRNRNRAKANAAEMPAQAPLIVKVLLALGGFAALAIMLEGARTWSWWASAMLTSWDVGGTPAAPELFIYPAFFTAVLALSRPAPGATAARFLLAGILWSAALFLADPVLRAAIHAIAPEAQHSVAAETVRGTLLYGLLFGWMYLTFRHLVPRGKGPAAEADTKRSDKATGAAESDSKG